MSKLVTIFGGSGFVGRYIARRMAKAGWRVRVAVRNPNEAMFVKPYGAVGQCEPVFCNIRDDASVTAALSGADAAVNCVGTFDKRGRNNFDAVQAEAPARIARLAAEAGATGLVHISAIGADAGSESDYCRTKGEGEAAVRAAFPGAVILRPSVIFGPEDNFFNRFAGMASFSPIIPVVHGETLIQPVFVDDVAAAAEAALTTDAAPGIYELGGPEKVSFAGLMHKMLEVIQKRRLVFDMPVWMGRLVAGGSELGQRLTFGIVTAPITRDQIIALETDNVAADDALGLGDLGVTPTPMETVLPEYLWRFRPSGQYAEIKNSARNLRT